MAIELASDPDDRHHIYTLEPGNTYTLYLEPYYVPDEVNRLNASGGASFPAEWMTETKENRGGSSSSVVALMLEIPPNAEHRDPEDPTVAHYRRYTAKWNTTTKTEYAVRIQFVLADDDPPEPPTALVPRPSESETTYYLDPETRYALDTADHKAEYSDTAYIYGNQKPWQSW